MIAAFSSKGSFLTVQFFELWTTEKEKTAPHCWQAETFVFCLWSGY
ncbi:TPA: hypothetical protein ACFRHF_002197 [Neisseria lactamica]|nr:hypothetical protein [Neisseria lactamica]